MSTNAYLPPRSHPNELTGLTIDPKLLVRDKITLPLDAPEFQVSFNDIISVMNASIDQPEAVRSPSPVMQLNKQEAPAVAPTRGHASVEDLPRHTDTYSASSVKRGIFTDDQKAIIQQHSHETPSSVRERLQKRDPNMRQTYLQIKGAIEKERRKQKRREKNGPWIQKELDIIRSNLHLAPRVVLELVRAEVPHCRKNMDQLKDMMSQMSRSSTAG